MKNEPLPIGYIEVQRSWLGYKSGVAVSLLLQDVAAEVLAQYPNYEQHSARIEHVKDGAGVDHCTLYVGYAPTPQNQTTPPLNPRNQNDAPEKQIGNASEDLPMPLGWKEGQFGRGT
jgi:hypothetical protein